MKDPLGRDTDLASASTIQSDKTKVSESTEKLNLAPTEAARSPDGDEKGQRARDGDVDVGDLLGGRYEVLSVLGRGGEGVVVRARDRRADSVVALKLLLQRSESDPRLRRLRRELQMARKVTHPGVVRTYDLVELRGRFGISMEFVDGTALDVKLAGGKTLPKDDLLALALDLARALGAAHAAGVTHRDLKPANVLMRASTGRAVITDFGISRLHDADPSEVIAAPTPQEGSVVKLTQEGALIGTPLYMSPEQLRGSVSIGPETDIYAFALVIYEAATGALPIVAKTMRDLLAERLSTPVPPLLSNRPDLPPAFCRVVDRCLSIDPKARFPNGRALRAALDDAETLPRRRRAATLRAAMLVVGLLVVGFICVLGLSLRAASERRVRECQAMGDRLSGVWDETRKEGIRKAFRATGLGYAEATWARVEKRLDAYSAMWAGARVQACAATRIKGEQSEAMLDLRASCLDERLDGLRALSDIFASADAKAVENAVQAASSLSSIEPCANLDQLSVANRLPSEPNARAEIRALQADIAGARELLATGKQTQSRERLEQIHARVEAAGYGPAVLAWTSAVARTEQWRDLTAAAGQWEHAITLAETYHLDREKAESEARLGRVLNELGRHEDAHVWLALAGATLARIGGDPVIGLMREVYEGWSYRDEAKYADAVRVLEPAIARANADHVDNPLPLSDAQSFLGLALLYDPARFDEAVTHGRAAVTIDEEVLGAQHPDVAAMMCNLAVVEMEVGQLDDALSSVSKSLAIYRAAVERGEISAQTANYGNALLNRGEILVRQGLAREAIDSVEPARTIYLAHGKEDSILEADVVLAEAYDQLGSRSDAARFAEEAQTLADKDKETAPDLVVELLVIEATLALERGLADDALSRAQKALAVAETGVSYLYDLSRARLTLARVLAKGKSDVARARRLAEQARGGFSTLRDQLRADEVSTLLAAMR